MKILSVVLVATEMLFIRSGEVLCAEQAQGPVEGKNWTSPATGMEFVWIPQMNVWVGKYEVTNEEYRRKKPRHNSGSYKGHALNGDRQPVVYVTFEDARAYAEWITGRENEILAEKYHYRLPSEKEWVTYARCGDKRKYPWGDSWPPVSGKAGNYRDETASRVIALSRPISGYDDGHAVTAPVDELWANPWGLAGVGGTVWEDMRS